MSYQPSDHGQRQLHLSNIACDGNEKDIKACAHVQWNTQCTQNDFVELGCCKYFSITIKFLARANLIE